jgi:hypothetical protein
VSGAAQFTASGASAGLCPVISASGAYCRLVSPAPYWAAIRAAWCRASRSGRAVRNRFHSPGLQLVDHRGPPPGLAFGRQYRGLLREHLLRRADLLVQEPQQLDAQLLRAGIEREVHGRPPGN